MGKFAQGYWSIGRIFQRPVRLHWSIPVGALAFSRFQFRPAFWIAFFGLVLIHELGHAFWVRRAGLELLSVDVHGMGGVCRYDGFPTERQRARIVWGGVWAQALVLVFAVVSHQVYAWSLNPVGYEVYEVLTLTNVYLIAFNLIPLPGFDGHEAWKLWRALLPKSGWLSSKNIGGLWDKMTRRFTSKPSDFKADVIPMFKDPPRERLPHLSEEEKEAAFQKMIPEDFQGSEEEPK